MKKNFIISGFSDEIDSSIEKQFAGLNSLGIGFFEPRGVNGKNISLLTDVEIDELKRSMETAGIGASSIGSPIGKIKVSDSFEPHFKVFCRVVEIAKRLGTSYIRMFSFYNGGGEWTEAERTEVFERLSAMIEYAAKNGVVLLHENEKDIYGDTVERCVEIMEKFSCDSFGAVFDPANFVQCGQDTREAFDKLSKYIRYMHIKDARSDGTVVPAGAGSGNLEYILGRLRKNGYEGFLSLEPHLGSFDGLSDLELGDEMLTLPKGGLGTFTLAHKALVKIIEKI